MDFIGHGSGMWFTTILFVIIIIYFFKSDTNNEDKNSSAQDILDKRFANGEIDKEEYQEKSNALKKNN